MDGWAGDRTAPVGASLVAVGWLDVDWMMERDRDDKNPLVAVRGIFQNDVIERDVDTENDSPF
jgi:hypothetical protein